MRTDEILNLVDDLNYSKKIWKANNDISKPIIYTGDTDIAICCDMTGDE